MRIGRKGIIKSSFDNAKFFTDLKRVTVDERKAIIKGIRDEAVPYSRGITQYRLPSGGGSYLKSIKWWQRHAKNKSYGKLYSDHPWNWGVENGTKPRKIKSKGIPMRIRRVVPGGVQAPWGTKYKPVLIDAMEIDHPGSRRFLIFRDTFLHIKHGMDRIIKNALEIK